MRGFAAARSQGVSPVGSKAFHTADASPHSGEHAAAKRYISTFLRYAEIRRKTCLLYGRWYRASPQRSLPARACLGLRPSGNALHRYPKRLRVVSYARAKPPLRSRMSALRGCPIKDGCIFAQRRMCSGLWYVSYAYAGRSEALPLAITPSGITTERWLRPCVAYTITPQPEMYIHPFLRCGKIRTCTYAQSGDAYRQRDTKRS